MAITFWVSCPYHQKPLNTCFLCLTCIDMNRRQLEILRRREAEHAGD
jgi:hypothetical protein